LPFSLYFVGNHINLFPAGTLHKVNAETLILGLSRFGILQISYGCTGIDSPASSLKDAHIKNSKLQGFFPTPGENLDG
jgi:hypothetical protein